MLSYIKSNPLIIIFICSLVVLILLYYYLKSLSVKTKKKEDKKPAKASEAEKEVVQQQTEEKVEPKEEQPVKEEIEELDSTVGRGGKKSRITRVYRRDIQKPAEDVRESETKVNQSDLNADFVDVSKNVSKFKTLKEEDFEDKNQEPSVDEFGFVDEIKEDCNFCEDKVKHFDHSRRLSNFIKEDNFDEMFASHLSGYADRIDEIDKHLNITDESLSKLYDKANKTVENSKKRVVSEVVKDSIIDSIEEHNSNVVSSEELRSVVDLKTMLIADTIMHRKKKK